MPDLTFYIDLNPEVGINRISKRIKYDRLDREKQDFHASVRDGYLEVAKMYPERIRVIDGNRPLEVLIDEVLGHIRDAL
jgi:dTMP kinase